MTGAFDKTRLTRMHEVMAGHAERGDVPGLVWLVARRGEVDAGVAGTMGEPAAVPVAQDTIFRISSMTKPVTAVATLILAEECRIRFDEPVDPFLPELADRHVLARPGATIDDTVPADRPITLQDLLTFRMGIGMDFAAAGPQPVLAALGELGLGSGPPAPAGPPAPEEWMRRLGTVPLEYQPGARWLYHTSADVLGVLVARVAGQPLETFLSERVFEPLGMKDTGFAVPAAELGRFGPCFFTNPGTGANDTYDPADGQWARSPAFPSGGAGLVSTIADYAAFAEMLRAGGTFRGERLLSRPSVDAMITNHLTPEQVAEAGPEPSGATGFGYGVGVQIRRDGPTRSLGTYGWDGGLGSSWANDPTEDLIGILLTNQAWTSPAPPAVATDFWTCAYAAIAD